MLALKHKSYLILLLLTFTLLFGQIAFVKVVSAQQVVTCPDGFSTQAPLSERDAICATHQTGDEGNDKAGCYVNGSKVNCPTSQIPNFDPNKCYIANGGSQGVSAYREVPCTASLGTNPATSTGNQSGSSASAVCDGSQDGSVICAPDCVYKDDSGNCVNCNIQDSNSACNLFKYIDLAISTLAALMGIIVVIMIIVGGIQYTTAGSDFNAVQKAKKRIGSAIGALVVFGLIYAIIQYLVPGGIF